MDPPKGPPPPPHPLAQPSWVGQASQACNQDFQTCNHSLQLTDKSIFTAIVSSERLGLSALDLGKETEAQTGKATDSRSHCTLLVELGFRLKVFHAHARICGVI